MRHHIHLRAYEKKHCFRDSYMINGKWTITEPNKKQTFMRVVINFETTIGIHVSQGHSIATRERRRISFVRESSSVSSTF